MVDNGDSVKGSVQDSLDDKKTLPTLFKRLVIDKFQS